MPHSTRFWKMDTPNCTKQQKAFTDLAKKVSPNESVNDYLVSISKDHPKANEVIPATSSLLSEIRNFCTERNIVTVPSKEQPNVAETPPFDRALTFASMDTPGAYEDHAKEAYYYITLPEPGWSAQRIEEHLRFYSYPDLIQHKRSRNISWALRSISLVQAISEQDAQAD